MFVVNYQTRNGLISGTKSYPNLTQAEAEAGRMRFCGYVVTLGFTFLILKD